MNIQELFDSFISYVDGMSAADIEQSLAEAEKHSENSFLLESEDERKSHYQVTSQNQYTSVMNRKTGYMYISVGSTVHNTFSFEKHKKGDAAA